MVPIAKRFSMSNKAQITIIRRKNYNKIRITRHMILALHVPHYMLICIKWERHLFLHSQEQRVAGLIVKVRSGSM